MDFIVEDAVRRGVRALYFPSATLAILCYQSCKKQNISIPEKLALIGYDGGLLYKMCSPALSQIEFSRKAIAEEAFASLMEILDKPGTIPEPKYLPPRLIEADSTAVVSRKEDRSSSSAALRIAVEEAISLLQKHL
ncbi:MAG: substrate-binding domain-containing protein [Bacteroidales bacterium]|nr:substrate-binding domain-containing protein [Bacteroidales bacterium]